MIEKWWHRSSSEELKPIPWIHPDAIAYLESLLEPDFRVLEHGSGGSTLWLAERVKEVIAIEENEDWLKSVENNAPANVKVIHDNYPSKSLYRRKKFDLFFIDGEPIIVRAAYLEAVEKLVNPGGYVVLDNANRPEYAEERDKLAEKAQLLKRIDGNEPRTHYLVTEFYRMPEGKQDEEG